MVPTWMGLLQAHALSTYQTEVRDRTALGHGRATKWRELGSLNASVEGCLPHYHTELIVCKTRINFYYIKTVRVGVAALS